METRKRRETCYSKRELFFAITFIFLELIPVSNSTHPKCVASACIIIYLKDVAPQNNKSAKYPILFTFSPSSVLEKPR